MRPHRHPLDEDTTARLLSGAVHPDDAPPGYGKVAGLLSSAASLPPLDEPAAGFTVAAMLEAVRDSQPAPVPERKRVIGKIFAAKAAAAFATVALTATGAAAATNSLPASLQGAVASAVSHFGIDLPEPAANHPEPGDRGKSSEAPGHDGSQPEPGDRGKSSEAPGHDGSPGKSDDAPSGQPHDNKGSDISTLTHSTALEGEPKGPTVSDAASPDGRGQAGDPHPSDDAANDNTQPGTTANSNSNGASSHDESSGRH